MEGTSSRFLTIRNIEQVAIEETKYIDDRRSGRIQSLKTPWSKYNNVSMGGIEWHTIHTIAGASGSGKCLGKGTYVLMYDNTIKKVEEIRKGELLMGPDSTPRTVLSIASGTEQMYWIRQNRGVDYRVNESHILSLKGRKGTSKDKILNISVKEITEEKDHRFFANYKGYKSGILKFDGRVPLKIDPYYLGLWLGDGKKSACAITTIDEEIINTIKVQAFVNKLQVRKDDSNGTRTPTYYISGERGQVESNILWNKFKYYDLPYNKHIPEDYMNSSYDCRMALLAGLLDSDGYLGNGYFEITQKDKNLSEQIARLARSCGFYVNMRDKKATIKSINYECIVTRLSINGECHLIPTRIPRKQAKKRSERTSNWLVTGITIEKDIVDTYYGFEIDGDRLFMLEDQTVTHNTAILNQLESDIIELNPQDDFDVLSFNFEMLARNLVGRKYSKEMGKTVQEIHSAKEGSSLSDSDFKRILSAQEKVKNLPIYYVDEAGTVEMIKNTILKFAMKDPKRGLLVTLDHTTLVSGKAGELERITLTELAKMFKKCIKYFKSIDKNFSVILLSQLNRAIEEMERCAEPGIQNYPKKKDIFGGDALYQMSDVVLVTMNPFQLGLEHYGPHNWPTQGLLYWHFLN